MMDSYLGDELLVETNHEVLHHLENCPACRSEMAARRGLLRQMRSAFRIAPEMQMRPAFAVKLRNDLRETALRPTVWGKFKNRFFINPPVFAATLAACLIFGVLFGAIWLMRQSSPAPEDNIARQNQPNTSAENSPSSESNAAAAAKIIQAAWRELTHSAVGDHKNCALHFRLPEEPIPLKEAAEKYDKYNRDLDKIVMAALSETSDEKQTDKTIDKISLFEAHSCVFEGKRFAHIILLYRNRRISVLVTEANLPGAGDEEIKSEATAGGMLVARFRTAHHAVFVVSDLTATENVTVAQKLSPAVRRHIEQSESGA